MLASRTNGGSIFAWSFFEPLHSRFRVALFSRRPTSKFLAPTDAGAWFGRMSNGAGHQDDATFDVEALRLRFCRQFLAERQIIARYLRQCDWNHASWIMLLELYAADAVGKPLSVSSLGHASGISIATAGRLTLILEEREFVERERDPHDARRTHVALTARGLAAMRCILDDCAKPRLSWRV